MGKNHGVRIKGGVRYNQASNKFAVVIDMWHSTDDTGEPDRRWLSTERFDTEDEATEFYRDNTRKLLAEMERSIIDTLKPGEKLFHNQDEI